MIFIKKQLIVLAPGELIELHLCSRVLVTRFWHFLALPELVYDWATSHGRLPFCDLSVSPSSEWLHDQMWLHWFDIILLSIISGHNKMRYKYYIGFVSVIALGIHEPKWTSHVKRESDVTQSCTSRFVMLWWQVVQSITRHPWTKMDVQC